MIIITFIFIILDIFIDIIMFIAIITIIIIIIFILFITILIVVIIRPNLQSISSILLISTVIIIYILYAAILDKLSFLLWGSPFIIIIGWVCLFFVAIYFNNACDVDYYNVAVMVYFYCYCYPQSLHVYSHYWDVVIASLLFI